MTQKTFADRAVPPRNSTHVRYDGGVAKRPQTECWKHSPGPDHTPWMRRRMAVNQSTERWRRTRVAEYEVSSHGRVRRTSTGRILKPWVGSKAGHLRVDLRGYRPYVHQLVVDAFIGERGDMDVCHNDGNPENNHADNLRIDTRSANVLDLRAVRTHCPHGHEYTPANTYIQSDTGWRRCRECKKRYR